MKMFDHYKVRLNKVKNRFLSEMDGQNDPTTTSSTGAPGVGPVPAPAPAPTAQPAAKPAAKPAAAKTPDIGNDFRRLRAAATETYAAVNKAFREYENQVTALHGYLQQRAGAITQAGATASQDIQAKGGTIETLNKTVEAMTARMQKITTAFQGSLKKKDEQIKQLRADLERITGDLATARADIVAKGREVNTTDELKRDLETRLTKAESDLRAKQTAFELKQKEATGLQATIEKLQGQLQTSQGDARTNEALAKKLDQALASLKEKYKALKTSYTDLDKEHDELLASYQAARQELLAATVHKVKYKKGYGPEAAAGEEGDGGDATGDATGDPALDNAHVQNYGKFNLMEHLQQAYNADLKKARQREKKNKPNGMW